MSLKMARASSGVLREGHSAGPTLVTWIHNQSFEPLLLCCREGMPEQLFPKICGVAGSYGSGSFSQTKMTQDQAFRHKAEGTKRY